MSSSTRRWTMVTLCLAGACVEKTPLGPGPVVIVVHAVLNPADQVQHVSVLRAAEGTRYGLPVTGAAVSLVTPDGPTLGATEVSVSTDPYYPGTPNPQYVIATNEVAVGRPYRLRVVLPTGEVVEGDATAPIATPATSAIERRLDRNVDTLRLAWPRVPGARAYEVRVTPKRDSLSWFAEYVTYVDTSITLPGTATARGRQVFTGGIRYDLVVSAVDANYYSYYAFDSDPFTGTSLPTSLRGAVGVFGALVPIIRLSVTVEGPDPRLR